MRVRVLGSAAGGGFPQWNCRCETCEAARAGERARPRTQSSLAIRGDDGPWFLVNASPDLREQLESLGAEGADGVRAAPIAGVLLTDAEIDHTAGLLLLREAAAPLRILGAAGVQRALTTDTPSCRCSSATRRRVAHARAGAPAAARPARASRSSRSRPAATRRATSARRRARGERLRVHRLRGHRHLRTRARQAGRRRPGPARRQRSRPRRRDLLARRRPRATGHLATARRATWAHTPLAGPGGTLEALAGLERPRKVLVHINNTNPILLEDSAERAAVVRAGVEVAYDGLEVEL